MSVFCAKDVLTRLQGFMGVNTLKELAAELGIAYTTVSGWNSRNSIPFDVIYKISSERKISLDWLINGEEQQSLSRDEKILLAAYGDLDNREKSQVFSVISGLDNEYKANNQTITGNHNNMSNGNLVVNQSLPFDDALFLNKKLEDALGLNFLKKLEEHSGIKAFREFEERSGIKALRKLEKHLGIKEIRSIIQCPPYNNLIDNPVFKAATALECVATLNSFSYQLTNNDVKKIKSEYQINTPSAETLLCLEELNENNLLDEKIKSIIDKYLNSSLWTNVKQKTKKAISCGINAAETILLIHNFINMLKDITDK